MSGVMILFLVGKAVTELWCSATAEFDTALNELVPDLGGAVDRFVYEMQGRYLVDRNDMGNL